MKHLTSDELIDLIDGVLAPERAAHVERCGACERQAHALRMAHQAALEADVPEPSPLFWDHMSARVRDAVAAEAIPRTRLWPGSGWNVRTVLAAAGALAVAAAVATTLLWRAPGSTDSLREAAESAPARPDEIELVDADLEVGDPWALVVTVADGLEWDEVISAGPAVMRPGAADRAVTQLSADEQVELVRLLTLELERMKS